MPKNLDDISKIYSSRSLSKPGSNVCLRPPRYFSNSFTTLLLELAQRNSVLLGMLYMSLAWPSVNVFIRTFSIASCILSGVHCPREVLRVYDDISRDKHKKCHIIVSYSKYCKCPYSKLLVPFSEFNVQYSVPETERIPSQATRNAVPSQAPTTPFVYTPFCGESVILLLMIYCVIKVNLLN